MNHRPFTVRTLALIGILGALSSVLMAFEFPLPFAPGYMKFEISDLPALFAGFFVGPSAGLLTELVKILLKLLLTGTSSALVGEGMNLLCACVFVGSASLYYHFHRTKSGALIALTNSSILGSLFAVLANQFLAIPLYVKIFRLPLPALLKMAAAVNPWVFDLPTFLLCTVLPFNLLKYCVVSFLTYHIYKKASTSLKDLLGGEE